MSYTEADLRERTYTQKRMCPVCHQTGSITVHEITNVKSGKKGYAYYHNGRGCYTTRTT